MSNYNCEMLIPAVKGLEDGQLTVGRLFYYTCQGDWSPQIKFEQLKAQFFPVDGAPEITPFALRVLNFELRDPQTAELKLVSYQTGEHKVSKLVLSDGVKSWELPGFQVQVQSVLTEGAKPFGPMGPQSLGIPMSYWLLTVSLLGLFVFSALWIWRKKRERKEALMEIQKRTTHPNPLVQFHRELRVLTKQAGLADVDHKIKILPVTYLDRLRILCEIYWGQKLKLALLGRSRKELTTEFKKFAPKYYIKFEKELLFWDHRWRDVVKDRDKAQFEDYQSLTQLTRELIENMESYEP